MALCCCVVTSFKCSALHNLYVFIRDIVVLWIYGFMDLWGYVCIRIVGK